LWSNIREGNNADIFALMIRLDRPSVRPWSLSLPSTAIAENQKTLTGQMLAFQFTAVSKKRKSPTNTAPFWIPDRSKEACFVGQSTGINLEFLTLSFLVILRCFRPAV
jgi:hypothetical protein